MKARGPGGNWFSENYDKLALVVMLVVLLASVVWLVLQISGTRQSLHEAPWDNFAGPKKELASTVTTNFDLVLEAVSKPYQVPQASQRMAVGELRVSCVTCGKPIPFDALTCPFEGSPQPDIKVKRDSDGDEISDEDEQKFGLNPADAGDAAMDLDGDKFSNLEEVKAGTPLNDPAVHPTAVAKLRMVRAIVDPFRLRFLSVTKAPGGDVYQVNVRSLDRTYFKRMGETVEGFTLSGVEMDGSKPVLILKQGEKSYRLVEGKVINEDSLSALMVFLLDGSQFRKRMNETIKLPDKTYKVVDIKEDRVVVRDEEGGATFTILRLTEDERLQLQQGGATGTPSPARPGEQ